MTNKCYFTPKEVGICDSMTWDQIEAMQDLLIHVLIPLREWYGKPITVNSGFRTVAHNKAVGGAKNSHHLKGEAVDITTGSKEENKKLFEYIQKKLPYDQLIDEQLFSWLHISFVVDGKCRKQVLHL